VPANEHGDDVDEVDEVDDKLVDDALVDDEVVDDPVLTFRSELPQAPRSTTTPRTSPPVTRIDGWRDLPLM